MICCVILQYDVVWRHLQQQQNLYCMPIHHDHVGHTPWGHDLYSDMTLYLDDPCHVLYHTLYHNSYHPDPGLRTPYHPHRNFSLHHTLYPPLTSCHNPSPHDPRFHTLYHPLTSCHNPSPHDPRFRTPCPPLTSCHNPSQPLTRRMVAPPNVIALAPVTSSISLMMTGNDRRCWVVFPILCKRRLIAHVPSVAR